MGWFKRRCYNRHASTINILKKEVSRLEKELKDIKDYNNYLSKPCPLCTYENGYFIKPCGFHVGL